MPRRLPPLNALRAFEAAARHESFTRAAEELCVTQGAVSHQVKALEAELGVKLFNRERQRLVITGAGRDYLTVVRDALDRIAVGTERQTRGCPEVSIASSRRPQGLGEVARSRRNRSCRAFVGAGHESRQHGP
jgi:DNA-binding transcriptional LysR family regulator